jgi:hypothetical protein
VESASTFAGGQVDAAFIWSDFNVRLVESDGEETMTEGTQRARQLSVYGKNTMNLGIVIKPTDEQLSDAKKCEISLHCLKRVEMGRNSSVRNDALKWEGVK